MFKKGEEVYIDGDIECPTMLPVRFLNEPAIIIERWSDDDYIIYLLSAEITYSQAEFFQNKRFYAYENYVLNYWNQDPFLRTIVFERGRTFIIKSEYIKTQKDIDDEIHKLENNWLKNIDDDPYWEEIW